MTFCMAEASVHNAVIKPWTVYLRNNTRIVRSVWCVCIYHPLALLHQPPLPHPLPQVLVVEAVEEVLEDEVVLIFDVVLR